MLCLIQVEELACIVSRTCGRASVWCLVHVVELACGVLCKWWS